MEIKSFKLISAFLCFTFLLITFHTTEAQDACFQKPDVGYCRASIPRFYFNAKSGRCDTFLYGGCGGNRNNFGSANECNSFRNYCLKRRGF